MRSTLLLAIVSLALVSAASVEVPPSLVQTGADGVIPEVGGVTSEEITNAQEAANVAITNSGAITTASDQDVATSTQSALGEGVICQEGEVICPGNICATECPAAEATAQGNGHGYTGEFQSYEVSHDAPPAVQGSAGEFKQLAVSHETSESAMEANAEAQAVAAAGLTEASTIQNKAAVVENNAANKEKVKKLMNIAAEKAAVYQASDKAHTEATNSLTEAEKQEVEQEHRVEEAKKVLEDAKALLHTKQAAVRQARTVQTNAQYHAEATAADYEKAKAEAIKVDNEVQAAEHRAEEEARFKEVAVEAVQKEAAAQKAAEEHAAAENYKPADNVAFDMAMCQSEEAHQCDTQCTKCLHCADTPEGHAACAGCKTECGHCQKYAPCMTATSHHATTLPDGTTLPAGTTMPDPAGTMQPAMTMPDGTHVPAGTMHPAMTMPDGTIMPAGTTDMATECSDCTTLPAEYKGGKCEDCPDWAAAGQCTHPTFMEFMHTNCKKSCGFCDGNHPVAPHPATGSGVMPTVAAL